MPHIHEKYDFVVLIIIVHDNKVLLVNHPQYSQWMPVGGHIELDEDPEEALFREVQEETGLEVEFLTSKPTISSSEFRFILKPNFIDAHDANPPHKHIAFTYFAVAKSNMAARSDEHLDMKWLTEDELEQPEYNLSERVKFYSKEALVLAREKV
ncbi:MAG: NUDIX domain-containing protein [Patescibacteria group bacterium]